MKIINRIRNTRLVPAGIYLAAIAAAVISLAVASFDPLPGNGLGHSVHRTEGQFLDTLEATYQAGATFEDLSGGQTQESVPAPTTTQPPDSPALPETPAADVVPEWFLDSPADETAEPDSAPPAGDSKDAPEFVSDQEPDTRGYQLDRQAHDLNKEQPRTGLQDKVASLRGQWDRRYHRVVQENELLEDRVADTRKYFNEYFAVQYDRLDELNPAAANYQIIADALSDSLSRQQQTRQRWEQKADAAMATQRKIMAELKNVDILMQALDDAADFEAIADHQISIGIHTDMLLDDMDQLMEAGLELTAALGETEA